MRALSRRDALTALGATGAALAMTGWSDGALATVQEAADEIAKFTGGKAPVKGKITIELPEIAENGNTVPLRVSVESPMTAEDYITDVLVVADGNPRPGVATFRFTPMSGKADISTRMRLAATQNIVVIARTNKGDLFTGQRQVTVTVGGCVG